VMNSTQKTQPLLTRNPEDSSFSAARGIMHEVPELVLVLWKLWLTANQKFKYKAEIKRSWWYYLFRRTVVFFLWNRLDTKYLATILIFNKRHFIKDQDDAYDTRPLQQYYLKEHVLLGIISKGTLLFMVFSI
jgi:hypothetical protein